MRDVRIAGRCDNRPIATCAALVALLFACAASASGPSSPEAALTLTLDEALARADSADAALPIAAAQIEIARQEIGAARSLRYPAFFVDGDVHDGAPAGYASGDARLQLVAADTLYAAGAAGPTRRIAESRYRSAVAGYRAGRKDVALEVRRRFAEALRYQREVEVRGEGIGRLRNYAVWLESRHAAGEGVSAELLSARTRAAAEEANIADAERQRDEAKLELNELMGRDPRAPLELVPLPPPAPPEPAEGEPWMGSPEVEQASADSIAAQHGISLARAERRPTLWASLNAGFEPTFGPQGAPLNTGSGHGVEATIGVTLPLLDFGGYRARLEQANLQAGVAREAAARARREARLAWARADLDVTHYLQLYRLRAQSVPIARDSYLQAESTYRGGAGSALEVLDAYAAWMDAEVAEADAALNYRQAEAERLRWGTP